MTESYEFDESDQRFELLLRRIQKSLPEKEAEGIFDELAIFWESLLKREEPKTDMRVFFQVAELLERRLCEKKTWQWIEQIAVIASDARKVAMRIAFLEGIPEEPRRDADLNALWSLWRNEYARWAVYMAYKNTPELIAVDHKRIAKGQCGTNSTWPQISYDEMSRWMSLQ